MIEMKAKIERAIYEASMALDNNNWAGWLSLCDEEFNYKITAFSPEINKDMIYFEHNKGELANLLDMLPKHNTDHSPLFVIPQSTLLMFPKAEQRRGQPALLSFSRTCSMA